MCVRCGNCCRGEGIVRLAEGEPEKIAAFLGVTTEEFVNAKTELALDRRGLVLKDDPETGDCIFFRGGDCEINDVKPRQCRGFPTEWNNEGWENICEGAKSRKQEGL